MTLEEQYLKLVCDELKVSPEAVKSKCRDRELCEARQVTSCVLKKHTRMSLWGIARFLNYVSHASPIRDIKEVPALMAVNRDFRNKIEPVFVKASQFSRDLRHAREEKLKQEEYDRIFAALKEEDWYNNVYYAESLMLPV
jgi:hypothetical protein